MDDIQEQEDTKVFDLNEMDKLDKADTTRMDINGRPYIMLIYSDRMLDEVPWAEREAIHAWDVKASAHGTNESCNAVAYGRPGTETNIGNVFEYLAKATANLNGTVDESVTFSFCTFQTRYTYKIVPLAAYRCALKWKTEIDRLMKKARKY